MTYCGDFEVHFKSSVLETRCALQLELNRHDDISCSPLDSCGPFLW